jgi:hypothetical protein
MTLFHAATQRPTQEPKDRAEGNPGDAAAEAMALQLRGGGLDDEQIARSMLREGFAPAGVARGLLTSGASHVTVAGTLSAVGYPWSSVARWLVQAGLHPEEANLAIWLATVGETAEASFSPRGVARALRAAGFSARRIAATLRGEEQVALAEAASALKAASFPASDAADALERAYAPGAAILATSLAAAGFTPAETRDALVQALTITPDSADLLVRSLSQ